jgi:hypothetical protein
MDANGRTIWIADAHRGDGKRFIVHADEKLSALVELERQVLTVTFYLASKRRRDTDRPKCYEQRTISVGSSGENEADPKRRKVQSRAHRHESA